jgi:hypothetical protein
MSSAERLDEFQEFVPHSATELTFSDRFTDDDDHDEDRLRAVSLDSVDETVAGESEFNEIPMSAYSDEDNDTTTAAGAVMSTSVNAEFVAVDTPAVLEISQFEQLWLAASVPEPVALRQVHQWYSLTRAGSQSSNAAVRVLERLFVPLFVSTVRFEISVDLPTGTVTEYTDDRDLLTVATLDVERTLLFELLRARGFTTARNSHLPALPDETVVVNYQSHATVSSASSLWHLRRISDDLEAWGRLCAVQCPPPDVNTRLGDVLPVSLVSNCDEGALVATAADGASPNSTLSNVTLGSNAAERILRRLNAPQSTGTHVTVKSASHRVLWLPVLVAEAGGGGASALVSGVMGEVVGRHAAATSSDSSAASSVIGMLWSTASSLGGWWQQR